MHYACIQTDGTNNMFRWFKKTKSNNEENSQVQLNRFEQYSEKQQSRLEEAHQAHITSLNKIQLDQTALQNSQIVQLQNDVEYYRRQIAKQQTTIDQLGGRYDAVIGSLITEKRKAIKEIFSDDDFIRIQPSELITEQATNKDNDTVTTPVDSDKEEDISTVISEDSHAENTVNVKRDAVEKPNVQEDDLLFDKAISQRKSGDSEQAFLLFEQAAKQGHIKAMGAMGRSFFLGEGTAEDHSLGLAWLINAANHDLPQALDRVKHFQDNDPDLYQEALDLSINLA